ncbi:MULTISPECIES: cytosine permease [unclassified Microbacterium]|uniref:purine-cytosine permease family protein n=1 Tax=unclassified Microbacterium TaxID=2609290 RepID=UPI0012FC3571|nr:cytosine permease [Microbacterium sp. MAH-37]MVQ40561.1 nitrate reductase [Microbacterium sp. MAH-37]
MSEASAVPTLRAAAQEPGSEFVDAANTPETRGIELIDDTQRHGRARDLFFVWSAPGVSVLNITVGASMTLVLGLEIWQALLVVLASSVLAILPGIVAISGPAAGTSGSVIQRAIYGIHGNKIVIAFYGWFISGVFLALNWVAASFIGGELLGRWGFPAPVLAPILVAVVVSAITVLVAVYGHALILKAYMGISIGLFVIFALVIGFIAPTLDWGFSQPAPLDGVPLWVSITIAFALMASSPLSFSNSADMARYLPRETKASGIIGATSLGQLFPAVLITAFGVVLGGSVGPETLENGIEYALLENLPVWLAPLFVLGVLVNCISLNGMTTYTASMALQSIGVPIRRIPSAILIGALGCAFTIVLVLASDLISAVNLMLQFLLIISVPTMGVYVADIVLRRNRYDGDDLFDERPGGMFWYLGGFGVAGLVSVVVGGFATAMFLSTTVWSGPWGAALGGLDLSVPVGLIVSVGLYALLAGRTVRAQIGA